MSFKDDFIAKYGNEAYQKKLGNSKEYYEDNKELCSKISKIYIAERKNTDKLFAFKRYYKQRRWSLLKESPKMKCNELIEAIGNSIVKEAERDGNPALANPDFLYERYKDNCKYNLMYGNWQIFKYFIRHMHIKIYMDLSGHPNYTDHDKEMYTYFRSLHLTPANKCSSIYLAFMDDVFFDIPEDIKEEDDFFRKAILLEDMVRNAKLLDLYQPEIFWF